MLFTRYSKEPFGSKPGEGVLTEVARRQVRPWVQRVKGNERASSWFASAQRMGGERRQGSRGPRGIRRPRSRPRLARRRGPPPKETVSVYYGPRVINRVLGLGDAHAAQGAHELGVQHPNIRAEMSRDLRRYYDHDPCTPGGAAVDAQGPATPPPGQMGESPRPAADRCASVLLASAPTE
jgi:hypothetical protein